MKYSLKKAAAPLGVAEHRLIHDVPEGLKGELPTIEKIEEELEMRFQSSGGREKKQTPSIRRTLGIRRRDSRLCLS